MPEATFFRNLKKWIWGFFIGQVILILISGTWYASATNSRLDGLTKELDYIRMKMDSKADLQTVLRIKTDSDAKLDIIINDLRDIRLMITDHVNGPKTVLRSLK
jgi:hypothetical protein